MEPELYDLIRNSKSEDGGEYTHVSFYGPQMKLYLKSNEQSGFWQKYCDLADSSNVIDKQPNLGLCIGEKPQNYMPVVVRATLKFQNDENFQQYDDDFILAVVFCYQQVIAEICKIDERGTQLLCCVLGTDEISYVDSYCICNFALQFPYCKTELILQSRAIRPRVIQLLRSGNVFARLPHQPVNDWETILDPLVTQEPWPLYRSTSNPAMHELTLMRIYGKVEQEHIDAGEGPEVELSDVFTPEQHQAVNDGLIPASLFCGENIDFEHWLPLFLSIGYWNQKIMPTDESASEIYKKNTSVMNSVYSLETKEETSLDIIDRLLPLLSRDRIDTDHYWIDVGKALYNESLKSGSLEHGLMLWIRFTERSDTHTVQQCQEIYQTFNLENPITIKTIAFYAKQDSAEAYQMWHDAWCLPTFDRATSGEHSDVAEALYRMYWLEFVCSNADKKRWYHFTNHRWFSLDSGITLRKYISGNFRSKFEQMSSNLTLRRQQTNDEKEKEIISVSLKRIEALIRKLKSVPFKGNLMKEAIEKFHDANFDKFIDSNPNIMGLFNGVIDTSQSRAYVRDGKPEDYVAKCCNLYWRSDFHWKHPIVDKCMKWLRQVFTDDTLLNYALKLFASCLRGRNSDKLFPIFTGEGDNSKSMLKKLFEATFGSYCTTFPTTLFTSKRANSSAPTPEVAQAKGGRISFLQEPDSDDPFRNGVLKEMTGGDSFFCRMLNDNGGMVEATFKLFLMCNKVPLIPNSDKAVKNRLRIVPFLSTWVDKAPISEAEQFKLRLFQKDPFFEKQITELAPAFLWILVQYFEIYIAEKLVEPEIIKEHTAEYWKDNDVYQQFLAENIKPAEVTRADNKKERDMNATMNFNEVYSIFKFWFKDSFSGLKIPDKSTAKHELCQRLGKLGKNGWIGIKSVQQTANVETILTA